VRNWKAPRKISLRSVALTPALSLKGEGVVRADIILWGSLTPALSLKGEGVVSADIILWGSLSP